MRALLFALALAACASAPEPPSADVGAVIAVERAFAARAGEIGWGPAFREYAAADATLGQPGYPNAQAALAETPDDGNRDLQWWPAFAGIARSGDFGFTTGPVSFDAARTPRGHYFTVWRKQADGTWRWIYDGGVGPIAEPDLIARDAADVPALPFGAAGAGSPALAIAEVRVLEEGEGLAAYAAPEVQVFRSRQVRVVGEGVGAAAIGEGGEFRIVRMEASAAGDMVMVLGEAGAGLFARVWQHRPEGWRIVYDQRVTPRPPAG